MVELKQAINQPSGELPSEIPKDREALHHPHSQLSGQLSSELLATRPGELISELPSESLTITSDADSTLTQATVSEEALAPNNKEVAAQNPSRLTGAALARRLGVAPASISRNKQKENFAAWTSIHDPDGLSWEFDGQTFQRVSSSPAS